MENPVSLLLTLLTLLTLMIKEAQLTGQPLEVVYVGFSLYL